MRVIPAPCDMQQEALVWKRAGRTTALVPTMGALHEGHLSLLRVARQRADVVVVSIFVNPTQFGPSEDLDAYPRHLERDVAACRAEGVDVVFAPHADAMYPADASTWVDETALSKGLCGAGRPGHFRGVTTVVTKLFNLVMPDVAVFGAKDYQQACVIQRMVRDLDYAVEIVVAPTQRAADGLALSSRNAYLSATEREMARAIPQSLQRASEWVAAGCTSGADLIGRLHHELEGAGLEVEYVAVLDAESLVPCEALIGQILVAIAVRCGTTRLIDNTVVDVRSQG